MTPAQIKSEHDLLAMKSTLWSDRDFWINVNHDGSIAIVRQMIGQPATQHIQIPRRSFARMVEWYLKEQGQR